MMNQEVKRRIDNARNVLVGKVPDPKSQVEQITTALIYKFMDDMDMQSVNMGGKPRFFAGEYEKYSWRRLMSPSLGGQARLSLYSEAIEGFSKNPDIPPLFREIFKDSYLPYRDPETLNLFLKEIDNFSYGATDNIGDAYEYLLSVLGSQGNAGQFLTPRHIINFIVQTVDPKKNETILDPACGTAGFLILAYLHILESNTDKKLGDLLTPDDKQRLSNNFVGYDIDPGMVRISLVNMYLHGFQLPHIYEYDTLTDDRRWQDQFDVIMANPPFMTPKGGIRPHKLFSVHANKSEVLFVDYIAEHLTLNGRAGVIVPEGIIFQSANAYKNLRKMLLDGYLWAVVSLPAGVFLPYSGVKTSILFMDKKLAKQTDKILFVKIENDGFDLGAQRRPIDKNDLPFAGEIMNYYKERAREGANVELPDEYKKIAHIVPKQKILDSGDYNLTGDRYIENHISINQKWPMVRLGGVCEIVKDKPPIFQGKLKYFSTGNIGVNESFGFEMVEYETRPSRADLFPKVSDVGFAKMKNTRKTILIANEYAGSIFSTGFCFLRVDDSKMLPKLLFYIVSSDKFQELKDALAVDGIMGGIRESDVLNISIPLPPLEIQKQIVEEIDGYQKIIDGARQVVENWKPTIKIDPSWPMVKLGDVAELIRGLTYSKDDEVAKDGITVLRANNINLSSMELDLSDIKMVNPSVSPDPSKKLKQNDIFICLASGSKDHIGKVAFIKEDTNYYFGGFMGAVRIKSSSLIPKYLFYQLSSPVFNSYLREQISGANINNLNSTILYRFMFSLPPLEVQKKIVEEIEEEQKAVDACKKLIEINEQKIKSKISEVWGE